MFQPGLVDVIELPETETDEVVQARFLACANEAFRSSVRCEELRGAVRRSVRCRIGWALGRGGCGAWTIWWGMCASELL
jgi:hypothetical protein